MKLNLVNSRAGATWVRQGMRAFFALPMAFFSLFMLFMACIALLSVLPVVGGWLGLMLVPGMTLGLMVATEQVALAQAAGQRPLAAGLFVAALAAVRLRLRPLLVLGAMFAVCVVVAVWLASLFDGGPARTAFKEDGSPNLEVLQSASFQLGIWLRLAVYAPISLLFWHAPALVHWHGVPPVKSLFFSMVACLRNFGAMTVFALVWLAVSLGASLVLGLVGTIGLIVAGGAGGGIGAAVIVGGSLALTAMFFCTNWFMFRDNFVAD